MKNKNLVFVLTIAVLAIVTTILASPAKQESWPACCASKATHNPACPSTVTKAECYRSCQYNCGSRDDLAGKKCRIACDIWRS